MSVKLRTILGASLIVVAISTLGVLIALDVLNEQQAQSEVRAYYHAQIDDAEVQKAHDYNEGLAEGISTIPYADTLNFGNGALGVISIPKIGIEYTIYHGVADSVLNDYVGHMPSSLLPIGDKGVSVLTAHNGIPSKPLFTDLDMLEAGDTFTVTINKTPYTYEVFKREVLPVKDVQKYLERREDAPVVDLMTCYPFGANTHRLIVSGKLMSTQQEAPQEASVFKKASFPYYALALVLMCSTVVCSIILIRRYKHV